MTIYDVIYIKSSEFERTIKHHVNKFSFHQIWSVAIHMTYLAGSDDVIVIISMSHGLMMQTHVSNSFFKSNKFGKSLIS